MPRELVMMLWCDFCAERDEMQAGEEHTFSLDGSKPHALVACEVHHKEVVGPFIDALNRLGIPVDNVPAAPKAAKSSSTSTRVRKSPTAAAEDPVVCVMCEQIYGDAKTLKNPQTLASHRTQFHGVKAAEYRAYARGDATVVSHTEDGKVVLDVKPLPAKDELWEIPAEYYCGIGECEAVFDPRDFAGGEDGAFRAVSGHRTSTHKNELAAA